jgi:hypothetical protein
LGGSADVLEDQGLAGEAGGALLDAKLSAVAVVAGNDRREPLLETVDVAHADPPKASGARSGGGRYGSRGADQGAALHGILLGSFDDPCPCPWYES